VAEVDAFERQLAHELGIVVAVDAVALDDCRRVGGGQSALAQPASSAGITSRANRSEGRCGIAYRI
jgi:hypothetical protein